MIRYDTSDLNRLSVSLGRADRNILAAGTQLTIRTAAAIERDAKIGAPVDTGNLRSGISTEIKTSKYSTSAEIGPTANYGSYVEFGTSTQAPQPYMGPAFDRHVGPFQIAVGMLAGRIMDDL